jgi:hypothetical protein
MCPFYGWLLGAVPIMSGYKTTAIEKIFQLVGLIKSYKI